MSEKHIPPAASLPSRVLNYASEKSRKRWASNPNTSTKFLERLAYDDREVVRQKVAKNPNTSRASLMKLSTDRDPVVVRLVIENPNTPLDAVDELARSSRITNSE